MPGIIVLRLLGLLALFRSAGGEEELEVFHLEISSEAFFSEHAGHHGALLLLEVANFFFDTVAHEEAIGVHLALLSNPVASVDRLIFDGRVPPRIVENHVTCRGEVETAAACLQREKEGLGIFAFLEIADDLVTVFGLTGEITEGAITLFQLVADDVEHGDELTEDEYFVSFLVQLI